MHEAAIAREIVRIVREYVREESLGKVEAVEVSVGGFSGVIPEALALGFEMATTDTPLAGARLAIEQVTSVISCQECGREAEIDEPLFLCEGCGSTHVEVIAGKDLSVKSVALADD